MGYRSAVFGCWKCKRSTVVYTWPGHEVFGTDTPPEGKPATIQWRYSKTAEGSYWANTCKHCGALIGDWFLYYEPGAPFADDNGSDSESGAARRGAPGGGAHGGDPL